MEFSWHMPIILSITFDKSFTKAQVNEGEYEKLIWDNTKELTFLDALHSPNVLNILNSLCTDDDLDVDLCISSLCKLLTDAAHCMKKIFKNSSGKSRKGATWFDKNCQDSKKTVKARLKKYRHNRTVERKTEYVTLRKNQTVFD